MFLEAGAPHNGAHFHAYYQDEAAVFALDTIECLGDEWPIVCAELAARAQSWTES